ncbi:MAG: MCE family protein [Deltaproteobacteria bacterium]|jgi:phospholipid/cholesterol/gamma-HCH transport system substrate-binding protein|nr:MCE family protein [Deltaproteobacteria bacterium]
MNKEQPKHGLQIEFREKMVGLLIVITMGLAFSILVFIGRGQHWFKKKTTYYTYFNEGYNLKPGAQVKIFNTWIGFVEGVELTKDNRVKITIKIFENDADKIRADSVATVDSPTIIGSEFIAITPGSPEKPAIPKEGIINSKAKKNFGEYLKDYEIQKKIEDFGHLISDLKVVMETLKNPEGPLFSVLYDAKEVTNKLKKGEGNLGRMIMEEDLYREARIAISELRETLASINELSNSMTKGIHLLPDTMQKINDTAYKLEHVMSRLKTATERAPVMQRQVEDTLIEVNRILESLKKSFLIRHNLPLEPVPKIHVPEIREMGR